MNGKESLRLPLTLGSRVLARAVASPFRREIEDGSNGLSRAKELQKQGFGLVVLYTHFSKRDALEIINLIYRNPLMRKKRILAPIALHEYKKWLFDKPGKVLDVTLCPVVTQDTIDKGKNEGHELGYGQEEYFQKAIQFLQNGDITIIAPQVGRREILGVPAKRARPIGTLIARIDRIIDFDKYAFLLVGLGIKGAEDYKKEHVEGLNPLKTYQLNIGATFTREEVMGEVNGDYREVDKFVFEQLRELVPPAYKTPSALGVNV